MFVTPVPYHVHLPLCYTWTLPVRGVEDGEESSP